MEPSAIPFGANPSRPLQMNPFFSLGAIFALGLRGVRGLLYPHLTCQG